MPSVSIFLWCGNQNDCCGHKLRPDHAHPLCLKFGRGRTLDTKANSAQGLHQRCFIVSVCNVDGMKDVWCSSTVRLLSTQTRMYIRLSLVASCFYWCWCSVLGDLFIPATLEHQFGYGTVHRLKAGGRILRWLWRAVAQWSRHLQLKLEGQGLIPGRFPGFFPLSAGCGWDEGSVVL